MIDTKLTRLAAKMEKANKENAYVRWLGYVHDFSLWTMCLLVLATGLVYGYEQSRSIDSYINPVAMVSYQSEYEAPHTISWYPITESENGPSTITINTTLRCDVHSGVGYEFTSSSTQEYSINQVPTYVIDEVALTITNEPFLPSTSLRLQDFAKSNNINPMEYSGAGPTEIATCYAYHTFIAKTAILSLPKKVSITSPPFNYVWYNNTTR